MAGKYMNIKKVILPFLTLVILFVQITGCSLLTSREVADISKETPTVIVEVAEQKHYEVDDVLYFDENNGTPAVYSAADKDDGNVTSTTLASTVVEETKEAADKEAADEEADAKIFEQVYMEARKHIEGKFNSWIELEKRVLEDIGLGDRFDDYSEWRKVAHAGEFDVLFKNQNYIFYVVDKSGIEVKANWLYDDADTIIKLNYGDSIKLDGQGYTVSSAEGWFRIELNIDGETQVGYIKDAKGTRISADAPEVQSDESVEYTYSQTNDVVYAVGTPNYRSIPDISNNPLGACSYGQQLQRIGIGSGKAIGWSLVEIGNTKVWVENTYLSYEAPSSTTGTNPSHNSGGTQGSIGSQGGQGGQTTPTDAGEPAPFTDEWWAARGDSGDGDLGDVEEAGDGYGTGGHVWTEEELEEMAKAHEGILRG